MQSSFLKFVGGVLILTASLSADVDYSYEDGKKIYLKTCVSCHGVDGDSKTDMRLIVRPRQLIKSILTKNQVLAIIKEGAHYYGASSDIMPSFKPVLNQEELEDAAHYVYTEFMSKRDERVKQLLDESEAIVDVLKMDKRGEKIFNRNCSMCHGVNGDGQSEYVEQSKASKNFIYPYNLRKTLLTQEQIFLYAKFGGKFWGTDQDHMPSWKRKYDDFTLKSVAKYVDEKIKEKK
jgi:cbb3-type cytochrome c oxidase subunit III